MMKLTRREFLFGAAATGISLVLGQKLPPSIQGNRSRSPAASIPTNRVVHTHSNHATYWDYATGWYGDYVNQSVVDTLTDLQRARRGSLSDQYADHEKAWHGGRHTRV